MQLWILQGAQMPKLDFTLPNDIYYLGFQCIMCSSQCHWLFQRTYHLEAGCVKERKICIEMQ